MADRYYPDEWNPYEDYLSLAERPLFLPPVTTRDVSGKGHRAMEVSIFPGEVWCRFNASGVCCSAPRMDPQTLGQHYRNVHGCHHKFLKRPREFYHSMMSVHERMMGSIMLGDPFESSEHTSGATSGLKNQNFALEPSTTKRRAENDSEEESVCKKTKKAKKSTGKESKDPKKSKDQPKSTTKDKNKIIAISLDFAKSKAMMAKVGPSSEPLLKKTLHKPTARDTLSKPLAQDTLSEPNARDTLSKPGAQDTLSKPIARDTRSKPTARDTARIAYEAQTSRWVKEQEAALKRIAAKLADLQAMFSNTLENH